MLRVEDEHGVEWFLIATSPATPLVNRLKRLHYRWVVLPRAVLMGLTTPNNCATMEVCDDYARGVRLAECVEALNE